MPKSIEFALGAAILSQILLALLWAGWGSGWLATSLASAVLALAFVRFAPWRWRPSGSLATYLPFTALGIYYLCYALAPPTSPDAIGYHLGLVTDWLATGKLARPAATGFYDAMPHGLEMLFFAAVKLGGGLTSASLVHFAFLVATLPLIARVAERLGFDGRPAALLYFATPVVAAAGTAAYVDAALAFYALAAFWLLLDKRDTAAGLAAGFCYAIKMSGGVVTAAACLYLLWARRSWRGVAAAAAMVLPWLGVAWWLTGNPVAPMLSGVFPSPAFHAPQVTDWMEYVRSYGVPWRERPWEMTLGGARAQGLLGPAYLLVVPLALAAAAVPGLRRAARDHRLWLPGLAAAVCAIPWLMNSGTRFLMPAAVFAAMAMVGVLPARAAWGLAFAQLVLCLPPALDRYVPAQAWRLPSEWPWRAALRIEPAADYLARAKPDALVSLMVARHARPGERVLDLIDAPRAYAPGVVLQPPWQYTPAWRALSSLLLAHSTAVYPKLGALSASWPRRRLRSIRFELLDGRADPWVVQEIALLRQGAPVFPSRAWELEASLNPWELPLAFDRNPASGWSTWAPARAGMFIDISGSIDCDGVELVCRRDTALPGVRVTGVDERGANVDLASRLDLDPQRAPPQLDYRALAVRHASREGYQWILVSRNQPDLAKLGQALAAETADWGLERVDETQGVALLRISAAAASRR